MLEGDFWEDWGIFGFSIVSVYGGGRGAVSSVYCQYVGVFGEDVWRR